MKDYKTLFFLGLIVLVLPFIGIPEVYKNWVLWVIGIIIIFHAFYVRLKVKAEKKQNGTDTFIESNGEVKKENQIELREEELPANFETDKGFSEELTSEKNE